MSEPATNRLALFGGPAVFPAGPPAWPLPDEDVRAALEEAFANGSWGRYFGPNCERLSAKLAELHGTEHISLCASGTIAVLLALHGVGVQPGDEVLLAGYDFPGNFRAIEDLGVRPVLVDLHPANWNLDPALLNAAAGPETKAVIVSHLHGGVVPMQKLMDWARERGIGVVEDACQCPGAAIEGRLAGTWGDAGVLSFGGSKLLTAGRGGAVLTGRPDVQQRIRVYAERGNHAFPLSELQAAVLVPQLAKLAERNRHRAESAARLLAGLESLPALQPLSNSVAAEPGYYKLGLKYVPDALPGLSREEFAAAVRAEGVALDPGFRGFASRSSRRCRHAGPLTQSRLAAERMLVLHHPVLLEPPEVIDRVLTAVVKAVTLRHNRNADQ